MWTHFQYTSGSNPYIAMNDKKANYIIRKWKKMGCTVEKLGERSYLIHDKEL